MVAERRVLDILDSITRLITKVYQSLPVTARMLASVAGRFFSLAPAVAPIGQLKSRFMHFVVNQQYHWDRTFKLASNSEVIDELVFWKGKIVNLNKRFLFDYS